MNILRRLVSAAALCAALGQGLSAQESPWTKSLSSPLKWYLRGSIADTSDMPLVNEALNKALAERGFLAGVRIEFINRPDYETKMNLINASGEAYDLALGTESWFNKYPTAVLNEYLINLSAYRNPKTRKTENLLKVYAPKLWASMPESVWKAAEINGGIHSVINQQIYVQPLGVSLREDVMNALGLKKDIDNLKSYEDLTPIMDRIHRAIKSGELRGKVANSENLVSVFNTCDLLNPINAGYDMLNNVFGVKYDDPQRRIVNFYGSDDFKRLSKLRRLWIERGYCPTDITDPQSEINSYKAGQYVMDVARVIKPGGAVEQAGRMGFSWYEKAIAPSFVRTGGPTATLTGISTTAEKDPARVISAVKLLEFVNSDPAIFNIIAKGVEGVHWNWADRSKNLIALVPGSKYNPGVDWAIGNQFLAYYIDPRQVGAWEETQRLNASSKSSVAIGFRFDPERVKTEIAALDATLKAIAEPLRKGLDPRVDESIARLIDNIEKSGGPKVQTEMAKQFSAWASSR